MKHQPTDDDFNAILIGAVRYSLGRRQAKFCPECGRKVKWDAD